MEFSNGQAPTEDFLKKGNKAVAKLVKILQVGHIGTEMMAEWSRVRTCGIYGLWGFIGIQIHSVGFF